MEKGIKEREAFLKNLQEKLSYYKQVVIDSSDAIIIQDFRGIIKAWNKRAEEIYGFTAKEMIGKNITKIIAKKDRKNVIKNIKSIKEGKPSFKVKQTRISKEGKEVFVNITYSPIYESEEIIEIGTTEENVTLLKESEKRYHLLAESIDEAIFSKDKDRKYIFVNSSAVKMIGKPIKKIIGKTSEQVFSKIDAKTIRELDDLNFKGKEVNVLRELTFSRKKKFLNTVQSPLIDNGRVIGVVGVVRDVTLEKKREEELRVSREKYKSLFSNMSLGVGYHKIIYNKKGKSIDYKFLEVNDAFEKQTGLKRERIVGKRVTEVIPGIREIKPDLIKIYGEVAKTGKPANLDIYFPPLDKWYSITVYSPVKDYFATTFLDVTEKKKITEELLKEKNLAQKYLDSAGVMILNLDCSGKVTLINKKGAEILGYKQKDILGKNWFNSFIPPKIRGEIKKVFYKLINGKVNFVEHYENPIYTKKGEERIISWYNTLTKDKEGNVLGVFSSGEDITKRKEDEARIRELNDLLKKRVEVSETKYESLFHSSADAIMILDPVSGKFIEANPSTLRIFGIKSKEDLLKMSPLSLSPEKQPSGETSFSLMKKNNLEVLKKGSLFFEWIHRRLNDGDFPSTVLLNKVVLNGKTFLQATVRDITLQKEADEKIKCANQELKEMDKMKNKFFTITSHELKTPLTPAKIQMQLLLNGDFGEITKEQRDALEVVDRNINRLDKLIGNILQISRLQDEGFKLNLKKAGIKEIIKSVLEDSRPLARKKGLTISYVGGNLPLIIADSQMLEEVFGNLIRNAIKFTEKGKITIYGKKQGDNVLFRVLDTGQGIPKASLKKLFSPFYQVEPTYTRLHGGTGLGLSIVFNIIKKHGGTVGAKSTLGKGSEFYFTLPIRGPGKKKKNKKEKVDENIEENEKSEKVLKEVQKR